MWLKLQEKLKQGIIFVNDDNYDSQSFKEDLELKVYVTKSSSKLCCELYSLYSFIVLFNQVRKKESRKKDLQQMYASTTHEMRNFRSELIATFRTLKNPTFTLDSFIQVCKPLIVNFPLPICICYGIILTYVSITKEI